MDTRIICIVAATLLPAICSCEQDYLGVGPYKTRQEAFNGGGGGGGSASHGGSDTHVHKDTTVYVSGIDFPAEYDWRQDSLYGGIAARVVLLRGGERIVELNTGAAQHVSAQADMHHLVDGHLYTEYSDASLTFIKRDGKDLYTFEGRESLRGILPLGTELYTLAQKRSGNGFVLRKGTEVLMERNEGVIQGTFGEGATPQYGALYEDDGHICFSYARRLGAGNATYAYYIVDNALETQLYTDKGEIVAARMIGGEICKVNWNSSSGLLSLDIGKHYYTLQSQTVTSVRNVVLADEGDQVMASALITFGKGTPYTCIWYNGTMHRAMPGQRLAFKDGSNVRYVLNGGDDGLLIYNENGLKEADAGNCSLFNLNCGQLAGGRLFLAATPTTLDEYPILWENGRTTELHINGILTGLSVMVED